MERTFLAINFPNWITVVLMVTLGYLAFAIIAQLFLKSQTVLPGGFPGAALVYGGGAAGVSPVAA